MPLLELEAAIDGLTEEDAPDTAATYVMVLTADGLRKTLLDDLGVGAVAVSETVLNDTQIKAWPTSPVTLLSAPGANKMYDIHSCIVALNLTAGYTNVKVAYCELDFQFGTSGNIIGKLFNDSGNSVSDMTATFGSSTIMMMRPLQTLYESENWGMAVGVASRAGCVNQLFRLFFDNDGDGNLTGGNVANVATITTTFSIVNV